MPTRASSYRAVGSLLYLLASSVAAQVPCTVQVLWTRPLMALDGTGVAVFAHAVVETPDASYILGVPALRWRGTPENHTPIEPERPFIGARWSNGVAEAVEPPTLIRNAMVVKAVAREGGVDVLFFVSDTAIAAVSGTRFNGAFWYARLDGLRWSRVVKVQEFQHVNALENMMSDLIITRDSLMFAFSTGFHANPGALIVLRSRTGAIFQVDTIPVESSPYYVVLRRPSRMLQHAGLYHTAPEFVGDTSFGLPLHQLDLDSVRGASLRLSTDPASGTTNPKVFSLESDRMATWWQDGDDADGRTRLLYARFDTSRTAAITATHEVIRGATVYAAVQPLPDSPSTVVWLMNANRFDTLNVSVLHRDSLYTLPEFYFPNVISVVAAVRSSGVIDVATLSVPRTGTSHAVTSQFTRLLLRCEQGTAPSPRKRGVP